MVLICWICDGEHTYLDGLALFYAPFSYDVAMMV
jgi:hypothetical protein